MRDFAFDLASAFLVLAAYCSFTEHWNSAAGYACVAAALAVFASTLRRLG